MSDEQQDVNTNMEKSEENIEIAVGNLMYILYKADIDIKNKIIKLIQFYSLNSVQDLITLLILTEYDSKRTLLKEDKYANL